ncbi:hypothetical protein Tco_0344010 [Tanacetum coccineum]
MNQITAQQVALDNALVAPENRVQIGKCNMRINPTKTPKEPTYQVVLDSLSLSPPYPAFLITAKIYPRLLNQEFDAPPSDKEIVTFIKELRHKGDIKYVTKVVVDQMHQPWRTFATIINGCLSRKISDFVFQIDNRDAKKQEKMYYPRFTKAIIHHFISNDKSTSMRNRIFMHTVRDDYAESPAYKTYLAFATGAPTPKKARKFKKPTSPSKKKALVVVEEPAEKPVKKPAARRQSAGVQIKDTPVASLDEAQLKKAIKRRKRETNIHQAGGSSEGADLELEFPDEPKGKSIDISEGTGLKPGVPDVSKADSSESEYESWGDSDDDDDHHHQSDDESTEYDDDKSVDLNKTDDEEEDEFVHTLDDYVPTDDENVVDEEYERINKEMYDDVNVELKDLEPANEEKGDEEMTHAENVNPEHEEVSQEVTGDQVKDDAQEKVTAVLATQKTEVPLQSSSISSDYATKFLNFDNIPSEATTSTTVVPDSKTLSAIHLRVSDLEKEVKELKNVDHSSALRATIKYEVLATVKEYLGTSLDDALYKVLQRHTADLSKEPSVLADVVEVLQQQPKPQKSVADIYKIKMEHAKRALFKTMTASNTFNKHPKHKSLYHVIMESILADEDAMDKGVVDIQKKRKPDDADKDEDPLAGPDQGLKRRKMGKDTEQSKKAKSPRTSKGTTKS